MSFITVLSGLFNDYCYIPARTININRRRYRKRFIRSSLMIPMFAYFYPVFNNIGDCIKRRIFCICINIPQTAANKILINFNKPEILSRNTSFKFSIII